MCEQIGRLVLIVVNILTLILGLAITAIGALMQFGKEFFYDIISKGLSTITNGAGAAGPNDGTVTLEKISSLMGDYMKYLSSAGLVIFIFGIVLFVIAFCGLCGACNKNACLLVIYSIFVGIILVGMIVLTCLVAFKKGDLKAEGETFLRKYIKEKFVGLNAGSNAESAILSLVMARLGCCGINNATVDFDKENAPKWNSTYSFGNGTSFTLKYPLACCKLKPGSYEPIDYNCLKNPNSTNSNYNKPCYSGLWEMVKEYADYTQYALIGMCVFLALLVIFAATLIKSATKD